MEAMAMAIQTGYKWSQPSNSVVLDSVQRKNNGYQKVFELVEKDYRKVVCVYINCQLHTTHFLNIFTNIQKLFGHIPPETGVPHFQEFYDQIIHKLQSDKESINRCIG